MHDSLSRLNSIIKYEFYKRNSPIERELKISKMERERSHLRAAEKAKRAHNQLLRDQEYVGGKLAYRNEAEFLRTL